MDDFDRRFETIGDLEYSPRPLDPARRPRTIEACLRENEEHRLRGIEVICRPTWQAIEEADRELRALSLAP